MFSIKILPILLVSCYTANAEQSDCAATATAFPPEQNSGCCGIDTSSGIKLISGPEAAIDQYPWLALIEYDKKDTLKTMCSGTLISAQYVMTAAHCVTGQVLSIAKPKNIRLGEHDTNHEGPDCSVESGGEDCTQGTTTIPIDKIIPHPEYAPKSNDRGNDIALIRMARLVPYTDFIRPLCLPTFDLAAKTEDNIKLKVAGWFSLGQSGSIASKKQHLLLPYVKPDQCQQRYSSLGLDVTLRKGQLCAGGLKGEGPCRGVAGGPLMYKNNKTYEAVGIFSFGPSRCGLEIPDVYTNVYEYNYWILSNIVG